MSGYHLFSLSEVTAAKPHRCIWCGEGIAKGNPILCCTPALAPALREITGII